MSKNINNIIEPKLRFPDFRDNNTWSYKNGNELFDQISNKDHKSDLPILAITQEHGAIPRDEIDYNVTVTDKSVESYKVVEIGDFIISLRSFQGGIEYSKFRGLCSPAYIVLRKKNEAVDDFFKYYFKTRNFISDLNKNIEGIRDGKMVSYKQFSDLLLPMSSVQEQQKIANSLSSIDHLLVLEDQKLENLKAYKQGLMQQLFPAKGKTIPILRFPEFREAAEWTLELLENKTNKIGSGVTPKGGDKNYKKNGRPFIRSQNVGWGQLLLEDVVFIDEKLHSTFSATEINQDDVLLNITGASIGRCTVADSRIKGGNVNQHVCIIRTNRELNPFYLAQYLISKGGQNQIDSFQAGGNRQGLNFAQIRSFLIPLPPKYEEQCKIADCLFSIDRLIAVLVEKIEVLNAHKKGLMQQLFPTNTDADK
ncbi:MAG: restriction endonuclease subunit S [Citrobacter freundii]|nr:MAG: restriction endonuclease subunit S [Citrobacter freundii]